MTSPIEKIDVVCPRCNHPFEDWYRPSINLDIDDFDEEYLDECASAICPQCKHKEYISGILIVKGSAFYLEANHPELNGEFD